MKKIVTTLLAFFLMLAIAAPAGADGIQIRNVGTGTVYVSPHGGAGDAVAQAISQARKRVWLAGYYFTSTKISRALAEAARRGVDVRVVLDQSNQTATYSGATYLARAGVPVKIDSKYPVMHQKTVVIDDDTVGFGSMNFTKAGDVENSENFNIFRGNPELAAVYAAIFSRLEAESVIYISR